MTTDVRLDPHEGAVEAACDLDRAYFDEHPNEATYVRRPIDHELCGPFETCLDYSTLVVEVVSLGPGVRARMPIPAGARA
jgi:hypothetical protein